MSCLKCHIGFYRDYTVTFNIIITINWTIGSDTCPSVVVQVAGDANAAKTTPGQQNTDGKTAEKESTPAPMGSDCSEVASTGDSGGSWEVNHKKKVRTQSASPPPSPTRRPLGRLVTAEEDPVINAGASSFKKCRD